MASQAAWIEQEMGESLAYLDINMGCPARKIVSKGDGSALMKEPALAASIVRAVKGVVEHPVTVKFRRGWAEDDETAPTFARRMEEAGADGVTVHGRFAEQLYRGSADWGVIARVREAVSVPVVGNGDIRSGADAMRMAVETGCDAVMIARGAEGNPWLFSQVQAALAGEPEPAPPTVEAVSYTHLDVYKRQGLLRLRHRLLVSGDILGGHHGVGQAHDAALAVGGLVLVDDALGGGLVHQTAGLAGEGVGVLAVALGPMCIRDRIPSAAHPS